MKRARQQKLTRNFLPISSQKLSSYFPSLMERVPKAGEAGGSPEGKEDLAMTVLCVLHLTITQTIKK